MLLLLNLPLAPVFTQLLRLRYGYLYPLILFTAFIGAYAVHNNSFSLWVVLVFGVVGYLMKRLNIPIAPLVLGLVIGPLFERSLVQTLAMGGGDLTGMVLGSPTAMSIIAASVLLVVLPPAVGMLRGRKATSGLGISSSTQALRKVSTPAEEEDRMSR